MKTYLMASTGVLLIGMSVTACSTGPSPAPTSSVAPVNNRTYTKADLTTILNSVNARLALNGSVEKTDGPQTEAVDPLSALVSGNNVTITPASCADLLKSDAQLVDKLGSEGVIASTLTSSKLNVIATAVDGTALPDSLAANFSASQQSTLTSCKHLTITETVSGKETSVAVDYQPLTVTTSANQSIGFRETYDGGGGNGSRATLEVVDGNLLIFTSGVMAQDETSLEKAVNAVVAAAK